MSSTDTASDDATTETAADGDEPTDRLELAARAELLERENRRLRDEYARAQQSQYRQTAAGLALIGICAVPLALLVPSARDVLFALAGVGLFSGVLTYYLTPGSFVAAEVGERIYAAMAANEASIADELGLGADRVYVPTDDPSGTRLYVPQHATGDIPDDLEGPVLTASESRGLALEPTGRPLFEAFEDALADDLATAPEPLAAQFADGLVEQFELAGGAESDVDAAADRATVAVTDSAFGDVDRFDHPIASFLAVGFAAGLEEPVRLEVAAGDERSDWLITCRWDNEESASAGGE